jgi:hypothetical protein
MRDKAAISTDFVRSVQYRIISFPCSGRINPGFSQIISFVISSNGIPYPNTVPVVKPPIGMVTFADAVWFPKKSSLAVGRPKLFVKKSSKFSGSSTNVTRRSCPFSEVLLIL